MTRRATRLLAIAAIALSGCVDLPPIEAGVCGNGVVETGEECDARTPGCGQAGPASSCRFTCMPPSTCPAPYRCGRDAICRKPLGTFTLSPFIGEAGDSVESLDFTGDGIADLAARRIDRLTLLRNQGDGTFVETIRTPASLLPGHTDSGRSVVHARSPDGTRSFFAGVASSDSRAVVSFFTRTLPTSLEAVIVPARMRTGGTSGPLLFLAAVRFSGSGEPFLAYRKRAVQFQSRDDAGLTLLSPAHLDVNVAGQFECGAFQFPRSEAASFSTRPGEPTAVVALITDPSGSRLCYLRASDHAPGGTPVGGLSLGFEASSLKTVARDGVDPVGGVRWDGTLGRPFLADVDGNGLLDAVSVAMIATGKSLGPLIVWLQTSPLVFADPLVLQGERAPVSATPIDGAGTGGDFDRDGRDDLLLPLVTSIPPRGTSVQGVDLLRSGSLLPQAARWLSSRVDERVSHDSPLRPALGDVNGDGWLDFVTSTRVDREEIRGCTGDAGKGFTCVTLVASPNAPTSPTSLAVGDFNGDRFDDLVAASTVPLSSHGEVAAVIGGPGGLAVGAVGRASSFPSAIDGVDLAASSHRDRSGSDVLVSLTLPTGDKGAALGHVGPVGEVLFGSFAEGASFTYPPGFGLLRFASPRDSVALADFDGDGNLDASTFDENGLHMMFGESTATFAGSDRAVLDGFYQFDSPLFPGTRLLAWPRLFYLSAQTGRPLLLRMGCLDLAFGVCPLSVDRVERAGVGKAVLRNVWQVDLLAGVPQCGGVACYSPNAFGTRVLEDPALGTLVLVPYFTGTSETGVRPLRLLVIGADGTLRSDTISMAIPPGRPIAPPPFTRTSDFEILLADSGALDGVPDLLLLPTPYPSPTEIVYRSAGRPDGTFGAPESVPLGDLFRGPLEAMAELSRPAAWVTTGDWNGDGVPDILFDTDRGAMIAFGDVARR